MTPYHTPALLAETLQGLDIKPVGTYVDLTFGGGGHSRAILERLSEKGSLWAIDQDADARVNAPTDPRFHFVEGNFRFVRGLLRAEGVREVDGVLADLGVSFHHFDSAERGFSFRTAAPLDMRMNQRARLTATEVVNSYPPERLIALLRDYGEVDMPHRVAGRIAEARKSAPIQTTAELIEVVRPLIPREGETKYLSKLFQALRIEVNGEMEALKMALEQSRAILKTGGRLVVISYHSLEDRLVKNFMKSGNFEGRVEKDFFGRASVPFEVVTRKAIVPTEAEIAANPRSRSAKLRVAIKR
ncbi:MAG: 16S rRNA (cytosine(1402)-N(4))-methyltransferase RsmH [Rikenellaceae bacterium]|jgi:16S rRNA (cytosine1402-N4)-methyltransferase|nr:16S rRNA (cytosine(1402)-N(4))-methyltransferase RsmH [Rikenellaceae bacterium]